MRDLNRHSWLVSSAIVLAIFCAALPSSALAQSLTWADSTFGTGRFLPTSLNAIGQIAGNTAINISPNNEYRSTLWTNGTTQNLGTLGSTGAYSYSYAFDVNAMGVVVGEASNAFNNKYAAIWSGSMLARSLGTASGFTSSSARAINDFNVVVGVSSKNSYSLSHATLWNRSSVQDLGTLGGTSSIASDINNNGVVVGYSDTALGVANRVHATKWVDGLAIDLDSLSGAYSQATAINNSGTVVGFASVPGGGLQAAEWQGLQLSYLPTLGGNSFAYGINDKGFIVGESGVGSTTHAALWVSGKIYDLNSFLDVATRDAGWVLFSAADINDEGKIVGTARNDVLGVSRGFILSGVAPIPEPETYALLLAGLGILGLATRRRVQKAAS